MLLKQCKRFKQRSSEWYPLLLLWLHRSCWDTWHNQALQSIRSFRFEWESFDKVRCNFNNSCCLCNLSAFQLCGWSNADAFIHLKSLLWFVHLQFLLKYFTYHWINSYECIICSLPDGICQLVNLKHLNVNDISLIRLPADIGKYVYLTTKD